MAYWHSMYSTKTFNEIQQQLNTTGCDWWKLEFDEDISPECEALADASVGKNFDNVNIYNIFGYCYGAGNSTFDKNYAKANELGMSVVGGQIKTYKKVWTQQEYTPWMFRKGKNLKETPPCVNGQYIIEFLNRQDVRAALHIPTNYQGWDMCTSQKGWNYDVLQVGSQYIYESLRGKVRMMHFSGDIDGAVPTDGSWNWVQELNRPILEAYRPYMVNGHIGGYIQEYDGFTYATVHGAGHMVP